MVDITQITHREYVSIEVPGGWRGVVLRLHGESPPEVSHDATSELERWRDWLSMLVAEFRRLPGAKVLKTSNSVDVVEARLFTFNDGGETRRVVCKHQKRHGLKDSILGRLRASDAERSFNLALQLHDAQIGTALPLCRIERRSPRASWLVSEFLENVVDLDSFVLTALPRMGLRQHRRRTTVICKIAELFHLLRQGGLYHRDMKASNLLLSDPTGQPRIHIVDVDGLGIIRPWRSQWKPIMRLAASLRQYPAISKVDYARFLREYMKKSGQDETSWRALYRSLSRQARDYAEGSHRRKPGKLDGYAGDAVTRSV